LDTKVHPEGFFHLEVIRNGTVVNDLTFPNGSTTQGRNYLLDAGFRNSGTTSNWYIGLIDSDGFSALDAADTASSHGGWDEFTTYDESTRQAWNKSAASAGTMNASSASSFTVGAVASGTFLQGAFIASASAKSATTGVLWATGEFPAEIPVQEGDIINITYYTSLT